MLYRTVVSHAALLLLLTASAATPTFAEAPQPLHLSLPDALRLAVVNSPDLATYRSKIRQAQWQVQQARGQGLPQLDFHASYTQIEPPVVFNTGQGSIAVVNEQNYSIGPTLRQAVATFGRLHYGVLAAQLNEASVRNDFRRVADAVLTQVSTAYDAALAADANVTIASANVAIREAHLRDTEKLYSAGTVAKYELTRNQSDVDVARQQLMIAQERYQVALSNLATLIGIDPAQALVLATVPTPAPPPTDRVAGTATALQRRPELSSLQFAFRAAEANVREIRSQLNPSINFQSTYIEQNNTGFNTPNQWTATMALQVPILDGGQLKAQVNEAMEQAEQLRLQYESVRRTVLQDVNDAWLEMQSAWQRLDLANKNVAETEQLVHVAEVRYLGGVGTNLERLDAENNLVQVRSQAATALYDYLQAQVRWTRATGQEYPADIVAGIEMPPRVDNPTTPPLPAHDDHGVPGLVQGGQAASQPVQTPGAPVPPPPPTVAPLDPARPALPLTGTPTGPAPAGTVSEPSNVTTPATAPAPPPTGRPQPTSGSGAGPAGGVP